MYTHYNVNLGTLHIKDICFYQTAKQFPLVEHPY